MWRENEFHQSIMTSRPGRSRQTPPSSSKPLNSFILPFFFVPRRKITEHSQGYCRYHTILLPDPIVVCKHPFFFVSIFEDFFYSSFFTFSPIASDAAIADDDDLASLIAASIVDSFDFRKSLRKLSYRNFAPRVWGSIAHSRNASLNA